MPSPASPALTVLVPGLLWPEPALSDSVFDLALPALQTLLGRGRRERQALDEAGWWSRLLVPASDRPLPAAALRRLAHGKSAEGCWLCADLVHLRFEEQTLVLDDPAELQLSAEESAVLRADLAPLLEECGRLDAEHPRHWHLSLDRTAPPCPPLLTDRIGQPARGLLPEGAEHRPWRRLLNEAQMLLHAHPVNRAREAAGQPVVNSLALWGGGSLPPAAATVIAPYDTLFGDEDFQHGLARRLGIEPAPLPGGFAIDTFAGASLAVLPLLLAATRRRDALRWREGLQALERDWLAPALAALDQGRLRTLTLAGFGDGPGQAVETCLTVSSGRADRLRFWRRPRPLSDLHP